MPTLSYAISLNPNVGLFECYFNKKKYTYITLQQAQEGQGIQGGIQ